jgi:myo-inositol 2-dehydrogenase/D-chiro-inositol 1-dehydrogenase
MSKLRIGIIGAGRIGNTHAVSIATRVSGAELAAVADIDPQAAQELGDRFHVPLVTADYADILNESDIEAVAICSSTDTHTQIIQDAAAAGKQIFCEKPIDHSLDKIDGALAAVEEAGVKFQVGFNRRFDANFRKVRELVAGGEIGQPHILRITSRDPEPPPIEYIKVSGGIFLDMTIHDFDMARYLTDSEVEEIYVAGGVRVDPAIGQAGDIDTAIVTLKFADGTIGAIDNSRKATYGYDQRVEVFGSKGMVAISNNTPDRHVLSNAEGIHSALPLHFFFERYMDSFVAEMEAFVTCVLEDTEPPVTGLDGRAPVVIGLAAWKSYEEGRPVRLSEVD